MKRVLFFLIFALYATLWVMPSFALTNSIGSISVRGTSCNGGGGWAIVTFSLDGADDRYITATANSSIARNVSNRLPGAYTEEFYLDGMDLSAPDYAIKVTVRLGTGPYSSAFDMKSFYFDCRTGELLIPAVDARDNRYSIPRNVPTNLAVARNDISALPLRGPRILSQPRHADVVNGTGAQLVVTADADYIGSDSFQYEICDISGLCDTATVRLNIVNMAPTCDAAADNTTWYWAPNHEMVQVQVNGVVDPDGDPFTLVLTSITVNDVEGGSGGTADDYDMANGLIRVERSGQGDGRTYEIAFEATDIWGESCSGVATIYVPHDRGDVDGQPANSTSNEPTAEPAVTETPTTDTTSTGDFNGNSNNVGSNSGGGTRGGGSQNQNGDDDGSTDDGHGNGNGNGNGNSNGNGHGN